ncbi:MAG: class I SAM-dependent methyltransferase [Gallionella sp.]|jgi:SAM-dependent methyltransferase|nr:class I SAM-dependent methyltransferase [Gallionella sp.]
MSQYQDGTYLAKNPTWDVEDSPWKAANVIRMMERNHLAPSRIAEVGCGVGEILHQLYQALPEYCSFSGYEISPQAIELCDPRKNERLQFYLGDILDEVLVTPYDLVMVLDVFEHVEDYIGFLRRLRDKAEYKIFHIPLDMSVMSVMHMSPILNARNKVGHLHYFCKETALATLQDNGYQILDSFYTSGPVNRPPRTMMQKSRLVDLVKAKVFAKNPDKWVRILGGSLMVLAK